MFRGLSIDDRPDYEKKLKWVCDHINLGKDQLYDELSRITLLSRLEWKLHLNHVASQDLFRIFPSEFSNGNDNISINGLVWMGSESFMKQQISDKVSSRFSMYKNENWSY